MSASVDDAIADIATVFHWPPAAYDAMPLAELASWRERARLRSGNADE
ncbi:GpE family phage tail protein [Chromobacterium sphagni]